MCGRWLFGSWIAAGALVQLRFWCRSLRGVVVGVWVGTRVGGVGWLVGTLLGPEATSPALVHGVAGPVGLVVVCGGWVFGVSAWPRLRVYQSMLSGVSGGVGVGAGVGCGVGLLFENCTVDASIFVAKFLRAHGGCLGTRSR